MKETKVKMIRKIAEPNTYEAIISVNEDENKGAKEVQVLKQEYKGVLVKDLSRRKGMYAQNRRRRNRRLAKMSRIALRVVIKPNLPVDADDFDQPKVKRLEKES
jgi:hypothetical protein